MSIYKQESWKCYNSCKYVLHPDTNSNLFAVVWLDNIDDEQAISLKSNVAMYSFYRKFVKRLNTYVL